MSASMQTEEVLPQARPASHLVDLEVHGADFFSQDSSKVAL